MSALFTLKLGNFEIAPSAIPLAATVIALSVLTALGSWQIQRGRHKTEVFEALQQAFDTAATPLAQALDAHHPQRVTFTGTAYQTRQFLLDNRILNQQVGYEVLTPVVVEGVGTILVNRGWIPLRGSRQTVPTIDLPSNQLSIEGLWKPLAKGIRLVSALDGSETWPSVVQYVDLQAFSARLQTELLPGVVHLVSESSISYDLSRPLVEAPIKPLRHYGYAVQWYGLALACAIFFMVTNTRRVGS